MRKKVLLWQLMLLFVSTLRCDEESGVYLFSLDYLYPQTYFYRFEAASKELWSDLDILLTDKRSLASSLENNYLKTKVLKLCTIAQMLESSEQESRNYLPEDIAYLIEVVQLIEQKCINIADDNSSDRKIVQELCSVLEETKGSLEAVLIKNEEIVLC